MKAGSRNRGIARAGLRALEAARLAYLEMPGRPEVADCQEGPTASVTYEVIEFTLLHAHHEDGKFMSGVSEDASIAVL
jgi:hypothetical protein